MKSVDLLAYLNDISEEEAIEVLDNINNHANKMAIRVNRLEAENRRLKEGDGLSSLQYDKDFDESDCDYYRFEKGMEDCDEVCTLEIGIENCSHCIFNKALYRKLTKDDE